MKIGTLCGFGVACTAIAFGGRLRSGLSLDAIFLDSQQVFSVLMRRLRADERAAQRFEYVFCCFGGLLFQKFFFFCLGQCVFCFRFLSNVLY